MVNEFTLKPLHTEHSDVNFYIKLELLNSFSKIQTGDYCIECVIPAKSYKSSIY